VPAVSATIEAAEIAAVATGVVSFLGMAATVITVRVTSRITREITKHTVEAGTANTRATLAAAREDRLWEKQCAAYEETLAEVRHRQMKRQHDLRMYRLDQDSEQHLKDFFGSYDAPGWFQAQARLTAYASEAVLDASKASERAHREVWARYQRYRMMADDNKLAAETGNQAMAHDGKATVQVRHDVDPAVEEAEAMDQALIKVIRDELRSKPEAAMVPAIEPAKRRGLWHRR
jgi:hypothetical protein